MFAGLKSMGLRGIDGFMVEVEADLSQGLPGFDVVGLPDTAVRESRDRVRSAMKNAGFTYPVSRITVNLAPADRKKEGSSFDVAILLYVKDFVECDRLNVEWYCQLVYIEAYCSVHVGKVVGVVHA